MEEGRLGGEAPDASRYTSLGAWLMDTWRHADENRERDVETLRAADGAMINISRGPEGVYYAAFAEYHNLTMAGLFGKGATGDEAKAQLWNRLWGVPDEQSEAAE